MQRERTLFLEVNLQICGDQSRSLLYEAEAQQGEFSYALPGGQTLQEATTGSPETFGQRRIYLPLTVGFCCR